MAEDKPTVCVSFTPRDEAAALRVASALREAGVEVVLSSEGGNEAVDDCDLFLPIVSDNTQAQSSGRFRNEWQRAAQRAEAMADDTTFLLPVVVDGTSNREAIVPESFRQRPWLRFEVWGSSTPLVSRVEAMLERRTKAQAAAQAAQQQEAKALARSFFRRWVTRLPRWVRRLRIVWIISLVVLAGGGIGWRVMASRSAASQVDEPGDVPPAPVVNMPRPSVAGAVSNRDDSKLERSKAVARPESEGAGESPPTYSNDGHSFSGRAPSTDPLMSREAGGRGPLQDWSAQPVERRAGTGPARDRSTHAAIGRALWSKPTPDTPTAEEGPSAEDPTRVIMSGMPVSEPGHVSPDEAAVTEALLALWTGKPDVAQEELNRIDQDWIETEVFTGPPELLTGLCFQAQRVQRGSGEADRLAREAWLQALDKIQSKRMTNPGDARVGLVEAQTRALLGQEVAALDALRTFDDSGEGRAAGPQREHLIVWALLGDYTDLMDQVVARFREGKERWAQVHNWLRYDPRFAAWREQMAAREGAGLN